MDVVPTLVPAALLVLAVVLVLERRAQRDARNPGGVIGLAAASLVAAALTLFADGLGFPPVAGAVAGGVMIALALVAAGRSIAAQRAAAKAEASAGSRSGISRSFNGQQAVDARTPGEDPPVALDPAEEIVSAIEYLARRAKQTAFVQDETLQYRWMLAPPPGRHRSSVVGRREAEVIPTELLQETSAPKRRALETGDPQVFEVTFPIAVSDADKGARHDAIYRVDVVPFASPQGNKRIACLATDVTDARRHEAARAELDRSLARARVQLRLALMSGGIAVARQDRNLVYLWAEGTFGGQEASDLVGRSDETVFGVDDAEPLVAIKRRVLETGVPGRGEVGIGAGEDRRYFDVHVEPETEGNGEVVGVALVAVDVSHRHEAEERMRLVMRELTHRTKNLLAVSIAIARQTADRAGSVTEYADSLIGRLRALSAAQDLIVADNWGGVDLSELVWLQLAQCQSHHVLSFDVDGPAVTVTPEVSQNLGLALHELAANARRYGAFAVPGGHVDVKWSVEPADGCGTEDAARNVLWITWRENGGPLVKEPSHRGFGMSVLERTLAGSLGAAVDLQFEPSGLVATFAVPLKEGVVLLRED